MVHTPKLVYWEVASQSSFQLNFEIVITGLPFAPAVSILFADPFAVGLVIK